MSDHGRFKKKIRPMPSITPGSRKGIQNKKLNKPAAQAPARMVGRVTPCAPRMPRRGAHGVTRPTNEPRAGMAILQHKLSAMIVVADRNANQNEFQRAPWPAPRAPGNS